MLPISTINIINNTISWFFSICLFFWFALPLLLVIKQHWIQLSVSIYKKDKYGYCCNLHEGKKGCKIKGIVIKSSLSTECPSFPILCNMFCLIAVSTNQQSNVIWISPSQWSLLYSSYALRVCFSERSLRDLFLFFLQPVIDNIESLENLNSTVNLCSISLPRQCGVPHCLTGL